MTWLVMRCPHCRGEFRRQITCVEAQRKAEDAAARALRLTLEVTELRRQLAVAEASTCPPKNEIAVLSQRP